MTSCPFPIGFGGFFQTDPNSIYAGTTWEQKKDVFILAAGTAYPAGSTGGEAQHTLTVDEMPRHKHDFSEYFYGYPKAEYREVSNAFITPMYDKSDPSHKPEETSYTNDSGGSYPHNNMPPYFAMPFWIRTA